MLKSHVLPFVLEEQEGHLQCWAAVAVSMGRFYQRKQLFTQQEFARSVLGENCDQVCQPLRAMQHMGLQYREFPGAFNFGELQISLLAGHPVLACMRYFIGWHLVVIYGIDEDQQIWLADPLYGNAIYRYQDLAQAYRTYYNWSHSYAFECELPDSFA